MIRTASPDDCPRMLEVMFSTAVSKESSWWRATADSLRGRLAEDGGFVAEDDGVVVGCVMHVRDGDRLVLRGLAVRPESEGRGVGSALVAAVERRARELALGEVLLAVSASNLGVCDYYRRLGYLDCDEPYAHAVPGRPSPAVFVKPVAV